MSYYKHHVFFCTNQRDDGRQSCGNLNSGPMRDYVKKRIKELGLSGEGKIRINTAGCLDRCDKGPVVVVYPEDVWYSYVDKDDLDEIIEEHLINGRQVARLRIK